MGLRLISIHNVQFLSNFILCFCNGYEWSYDGYGKGQNGTENKFALSYLMGYLDVGDGIFNEIEIVFFTGDIIYELIANGYGFKLCMPL